ncbi:MAG: hypothetical protein M9895_15315, partial [Aquamicrobium sp.]|uniref:hypothetical protein n=1 Tax=Aquamicrobium sp. TaxID=1872579 RepID=UPI00349E76B5|nr:hypothetical protein [Aquamicrobium sp.]
MTDQDYVDFCNFAYRLRKQAEGFFAPMNDEHVRQLNGLVRGEMAGGKVEEAYDFLAAILAEEAAER